MSKVLYRSILAYQVIDDVGCFSTDIKLQKGVKIKQAANQLEDMKTLLRKEFPNLEDALRGAVTVLAHEIARVPEPEDDDDVETALHSLLIANGAIGKNTCGDIVITHFLAEKMDEPTQHCVTVYPGFARITLSDKQTLMMINNAVEKSNAYYQLSSATDEIDRLTEILTSNGITVGTSVLKNTSVVIRGGDD